MSRLSQVFVPKDREFFDLFEEAAGNIVRGAELLEEMIRGFPETAPLGREILLCEQEGDRITHDIVHRLNQTFVTPIDREDILELVSALDDVIDLTEEVADFLVLYKVEAPMDPARAAGDDPQGRLPADRRRRCRGCARSTTSRTTSVEIHRLENDGDRAVREGIASLFDKGVDPMVVIRWKDIFERLEEAIDAAEHVADMLETIVIKNS